MSPVAAITSGRLPVTSLAPTSTESPASTQIDVVPIIASCAPWKLQVVVSTLLGKDWLPDGIVVRQK